MFIKIHQAKCKDIIIGTLYRPPGNPVDQFNIAIEHTLSKLISTNHKIIVAGDFNINLLKLAEHRPTHDFFNIMTSHQLLPSILHPTRITSLTATLIDNIFSNFLTDKQESYILLNDISDHLPVMFGIDISVQRSQSAASASRLINEKNICSIQCFSGRG